MQFGALLLLTLASAVAEVFTLGALLPFLAVLANPDVATSYRPVQIVLGWVGSPAPQHLLLILTLCFSFGVLAAGSIRVLLTWSTNRYVYMLGHELSVRLYRNVLNQDYSFHVTRNTSTIIAAIQQVQLVTSNVLQPALQLLSAVIITVGVVAALVFLNRAITIIAFAGLALIYVQISLMFRGRLRANSLIVSQKQAERIQSVQEGLGGIRDVLINATQGVFLSRFRKFDYALQNAQASNMLASTAPRFGIEAIGMVVIAGLAYYLAAQPGGLGYALPTLGVLVLAAQRIFPLMQVIYNGWALIVGNIGNLNSVLTTLEAPGAPAVAATEPLPFAREIVLKDVAFAYEGSREPAVRGLGLTVPKGAKVGIVGETGSGKSTVADLLMGLLEPTAGVIEIDGRPLDASTRRAWQARVAHVPQAIFLSDGSIAENIAFGVDAGAIDHGRVREAAEQAALGRFIAGLPEGYETIVGERGIRLSGGERQRIGIARALYKRATVLFFDEATSALDVETERAVIESIRDLDPTLTIVIVAHRLTTVAYCDMVVTLKIGEPGLSVATPPSVEAAPPETGRPGGPRGRLEASP